MMVLKVENFLLHKSNHQARGIWYEHDDLGKISGQLLVLGQPIWIAEF